jgi:hypothetical protein
MTGKPRHRGPHPQDTALFAPQHHPAHAAAVTDLSWLLHRAYAPKSALKIVGDRYQLTSRQREAVSRCACGDADRDQRLSRRTTPALARGHSLLLDGFNVLTTLETALSGGLILPARDSCFRDLAGIQGNYRLLTDTAPAIDLIYRFLTPLAPTSIHWLLDQPVSNSGRLKTLIFKISDAHPVTTSVELVPDPDPLLIATAHQANTIIATADSHILDHCGLWLNLARLIIEKYIPTALLVPMLDIEP